MLYLLQQLLNFWLEVFAQTETIVVTFALLEDRLMNDQQIL